MKIPHCNKFPLFLFVLAALILMLTIRGHAGNPDSQMLNQDYWKEEGPLELSPERGRYALLYSVVEDNSLKFSLPIARFTTPDLGYINGQYVSLFAPGLSFSVIPGYLIGKAFDMAQIGAYAIVALFALLNAVLIYLVCRKLKLSSYASALAASVFLFSTPAFTYAVSLYQHHLSTFIILLSIFLLQSSKKIRVLAAIWLLYACAIVIDYPNFFLLLPIAIYSLGRFFKFDQNKTELRLTVFWTGFFTFFAAVIPIVLFLWFNKASYGNPLQLSGTIASVKSIDADGFPTQTDITIDVPNESNSQQTQKSAVGFFQTRFLLNGFQTHFVSLDRGVLVYAPMMLFGVWGAILAYKKKWGIYSLVLAVVGINILLYSMWGDPYGGWAFGSRYLIPAYALMSIFIGYFLQNFAKKWILLFVFSLLLVYAIAVNTLGAVTTSRNPPKAEAIALEALSDRQEKYTFMRNYDYLMQKGSKSFAYQNYLSDLLTPWQYWLILTSALVISNSLAIVYLFRSTKEKTNK